MSKNQPSKTINLYSDTDLLAVLETAGPILPTDLVKVCLERRASLTDPFLEILAASRHDQWELTSDARWFRGDHAGKFLIAYLAQSALPIFEQIYASADERDQDMVEWLGIDLAHFGETAVSPLIRVLQTDTQGVYHYGRAIAATTLKVIALQHPDIREDVLTALRGELPPMPENLSADAPVDEMWTNIVLELADLQDEDSRTIVQAMYAADVIDADMFPLAEYENAFATDTPPPPEVGEPFDIFGFYDDLRHQESHQMKMTGRRDLLRKQGYIPPEPDPEPYANRFSRWFNKRLIKGSAKD